MECVKKKDIVFEIEELRNIFGNLKFWYVWVRVKILQYKIFEKIESIVFGIFIRFYQ